MPSVTTPRPPLVEFLAAHVPLQHLYLNNNGLGPHAGILIADALSELHGKKEEARKSGQGGTRTRDDHLRSQQAGKRQHDGLGSDLQAPQQSKGGQDGAKRNPAGRASVTY